ncbi:Aldose 1-epimerase [Tupaia chinensis]|uniref:Galactose mutarotase n=1 Tax=Tupaia chinensis TaxID=246437 RepID=L9K757_TUPCH|nr:Aldose 1-epimerase [Tupaia chinensis]
MSLRPVLINLRGALGLMIRVQRTALRGRDRGEFQLQSDLLRVDIISWGCTITALEVKDRQGRASDVLGFAELEGYLQKQPYFGAVVGRVANRIAKGVFTLDGKEYPLAMEESVGLIRSFGPLRYYPMASSSPVSVLMVRKATLEN